MKTKNGYDNFAKELRKLCEKHGIYVVGTAMAESQYGEITLVDKDDSHEKWNNGGWKNIIDQITFNVVIDEYPKGHNWVHLEEPE